MNINKLVWSDPEADQASPRLAGTFPVWHEDEKLRDLEDTFNRLAPEIPKFIQALAEQVIIWNQP